jgi:hypothetical protein
MRFYLLVSGLGRETWDISVYINTNVRRMYDQQRNRRNKMHLNFSCSMTKGPLSSSLLGVETLVAQGCPEIASTSEPMTCVMVSLQPANRAVSGHLAIAFHP